MIRTKEIEKVLKALANHRRLEILKVLKVRKDITVGEIANIIRLSFRSTSRHLAILSAAGIVDRKQISLEVYYTISTGMSSLANKIIAAV